jgi:hypothetical protein
MMASESGHVELDNVKLSIEEIDRIEKILKNYIEHTEKVVKEFSKDEDEDEGEDE